MDKPVPAPDPQKAAYWTLERKEEYRRRGEADRLCRMGEYAAAREYCTRFNLSWPPFPKTPLAATIGKKGVKEVFSQAKADAVRANGKLGGAPTGEANGSIRRQITLAAPEDTENLIEIMKNALVTEGTAGIKTSPFLSQVTDSDKKALTRLANVSVEEFNARLSDKLGHLLDTLVDSLQKDVDEGNLKPGEKSFAIAISSDKRATLDGRNQISNSNIASQVNIFVGTKSRAELLRSLRGEPEPPATEI